MAPFEAPRIGHEGAAIAFNPGCLMNVAAQAEAYRLLFEKRLYAVTAAPKAEECPVTDAPGWGMGDQDDP